MENDFVWLVAILSLNTVIALFDAYLIGKASRCREVCGERYGRWLILSGGARSVLGFSMTLLFCFVLIMLMEFSSERRIAWPAFSLWYIIAIGPLLASGLAISLHSVGVCAVPKGSKGRFSKVVTAAWNVFLFGYDIAFAFANAERCFAEARVSGLSVFGRIVDDPTTMPIAGILVVGAIGGGYLLTVFLKQKAFGEKYVSLKDGEEALERLLL